MTAYADGCSTLCQVRGLEDGLDEQAGDDVWVDVGCGTTVLKVSVALEGHGEGDTDG